MRACATFALVLAFVAISGAAATTYRPPPPNDDGHNFWPTCPLALTKWNTLQDANYQKIEQAQNADNNYDGTGVFPSMSLFRVTLAPCGVRTMHTHANVDELLYVLGGEVSASMAFANGTICEQRKLNKGDSFAYPRNLVHTARNLDCKRWAQVLGFFTEFSTGTVQIAPAAFNMPGGPFKAYADPNLVESIEAAVNPTTLSFDPVCMDRCGFQYAGGQKPAPTYSIDV